MYASQTRAVAKSVSISTTDTTISDEEQEERSTKYDQITHFSYSSSGSGEEEEEDYFNRICLKFADEESLGNSIKCKSFWLYLESVPQLEALRAVGWKDATYSTGTAENLPEHPPEIVRRRWLCQLLKLHALNLHQVALAGGCPPHRDPCADVAFADLVEESGQQVCDDIDEFEAILKEREAQRDPNQTVLGYKKKQPPPLRV